MDRDRNRMPVGRVRRDGACRIREALHYDADGNRKGYITEGALGQRQVRDTRGVLLYEIRD